ncbi:MAG: PAS domain S-box protein [Anaeromyxobacteraceae bacterium]
MRIVHAGARASMSTPVDPRQPWRLFAALRRRPTLTLPAAYVVLAGLWITFSDRAVGLLASTVEQAARWSMWKGYAFVALTAVLLHVGMRWVQRRERKARERLEESEALLRAVTDAVADPVFLKARDGRWQFANPATLRVIGRTEARVLGRTDVEIYDDPAIGEALMATDRRIMATGRAEAVEEIIATPEGPRVFLSTKAPVRDAHGEIVGIVGSARDITERKAAERKLAESEAVFRTFFQQTAVGVAQTDGATGRFVRVNPRFAEVLGRSPEELLGVRWQELTHPDDLAGDVEAAAALRAGATRSFTRTKRYLRPDGRVVWGTVTVSALWREGAAPTDSVAVLLDITEQRTLEEQLHQSQRLESIGRLAGGVAHDFNNVLTVIQACARSLRDGPPPAATGQQEELDEILGAARRAGDLTRRLLAFARKQIIAPVVLDLGQAMASIERLLRRLVGEDVRVELEMAAGLWPVRLDPGQLEQVLMNLAANARDAMPAGGVLRIAAANAEVAPEGAEGGQWVRLTVTDSGEGMTPEVRAHLFEPFFTTKPAGAGTGLGLATVYGILRQNGAHVTVESAPGQGTRFDLWLPRARGPVTPPAPARMLPTADGAGRSLLLVEDDASVRRVLERALRAAGFRVLVAGSGEEALALPPVDVAEVALVVTDVVMPGIDGPHLAAALRARHPALRVLYLSGYTRDALTQRGELGEGVELLTKPFTPEVLVDRVRELLARSLVAAGQ